MSGIRKTPISDDAPSSGIAPTGLDVAEVVAGYPGPAVLVDAGGAILAANGHAQALLDQNEGWWAEMAPWRVAAGAEASDEEAEYPVSFERGNGIEVMTWRAVRLGARNLLLLGRDTALEHHLRQRLHLATQHASVDRHLRETLTESRQRYKDLVEVSSDFAWETDREGRFVFVSPAGALGWAAGQLVGNLPRDVLAVDDDLPSPFEALRPVERLELWMRAADGAAACMEVSAKPLFGLQGEWCGARGVCRDLTEQVTRAAELARIRNRENAINRVAGVLRGPLAPEEAFRVCAEEAGHALGASACVIYVLEEGSEVPLAIAASGELLPDAEPPLDLALAAAEPVLGHAGEYDMLVCAARFQGIANGAVAAWRPSCHGEWEEENHLLISGIAERIAITHAQIAYQERLRHLSERDGLTGLFNRRAFLERVEDTLVNCEHGPSVLIYMDLDNFKVLNDQRGHHQGDLALSAVAGLIRHNTRPGDIAGRMGGDEFVIWLARADEQVAIAVAERLLAGMASLEPLSVPGRPLSLSIGVATHDPARGEPFSVLIERADAAMYTAKLGGKNAFRLAPERASERAADALHALNI